MTSHHIEGIGSVPAGEYQDIAIEGLGKARRHIKAQTLKIDGTFKAKRGFEVRELCLDGVLRAFGALRCGQVQLDGVLKLRRGSLQAERITGEALLSCTGEVNADVVEIKGVCSVRTLVGDRITLRFDPQLSGPRAMIGLFGVYLGRGLSTSHSLVDTVECTELIASGLRSKVVRAGSVCLRDHCVIDRLYCDGPVDCDATCQIGTIYSAHPNGVAERKEHEDMANPTLVRILDSYKEGKLDADQAERMIASLGLGGGEVPGPQEDGGLASWPEDDKLRIVAYIGRKLFRRGEPGQPRLRVEYDGPARNVECWGDLICGAVGGNASAGGDLQCGSVDGNVKAGGDVQCDAVDGNVSCGGDCNCHEVHGNLNQGVKP